MLKFASHLVSSEYYYSFENREECDENVIHYTGLFGNRAVEIRIRTDRLTWQPYVRQFVKNSFLSLLCFRVACSVAELKANWSRYAPTV